MGIDKIYIFYEHISLELGILVSQNPYFLPAVKCLLHLLPANEGLNGTYIRITKYLYIHNPLSKG